MPRNIRPIRVEGQLAYVPLTKGYEAIINAADVPLVKEYNWSACVRSRSVYAVRTDNTGLTPRKVLLHRLLMSEPQGLEIDHRDGNGLNNRRKNLRSATHSENTYNRRVNKNNTSGLKGVYWYKRAQKWMARIGVNGNREYLGLFETPEEAHAAYCAASRKLHGEFGRVE